MTYWIGTETVRGTVIGDQAPRFRYRFYTKEGDLIHYDWVHFDDDAQAEAWFKENYPEHYKRGVEMRAWTN